MLYASAFQLFILVLAGWPHRRERDALAYLMEENRVLRRQLGGRRLRLSDGDRRHSRLGHTGWADMPSGRSPRSSHRTPCCVGIASCFARPSDYVADISHTAAKKATRADLIDALEKCSRLD